MSVLTYHEILEFWFSEETKEKWYSDDEGFDKEITKLFLATYREAKKNKGTNYDENPESALALAILFDQLPRHMFRDKKEAYATDAFALKIAHKAVKLGYDKKLSDEQRKFIYMPLIHSEDIKDLRTGIALIARLDDKSVHEYALRNKETILRFGRFPQRNGVLERKSTDKEIRFLEEVEACA